MKSVMSSGQFLVTLLVAALILGSASALDGDNAGPELAANEEMSVVETNVVQAITLPETIDPDSPCGQLVRLVQAGVDEGVILTFVNSSIRFFSLDADRIIYLTDLGTPAKIIEAAMARDRELIVQGISTDGVPATVESETDTNAAPEVTQADFEEALSPYGVWVNIDGYGRCWRPSVVVYNSGWRPYCDNGRWVYTDRGWYWLSGYSWGWATFHYGRWFHHARHGWCWWPDTVWAPSWVTWRYNSSYCGWAPLPPHYVYRSGAGFYYRGSRVVVGFDLGINYSSYTFVTINHFCDPSPWRHRVRDRDTSRIYDRTRRGDGVVVHDGHSTISNTGIPSETIADATGQTLTPVRIQHRRDRSVAGSRAERLNPADRSLVVSSPRAATRDTVPSNRSDSDTGRSGSTTSLAAQRAASRSSDPSSQTPTPSVTTSRRTDPSTSRTVSTPPRVTERSAGSNASRNSSPPAQVQSRPSSPASPSTSSRTTRTAPRRSSVQTSPGNSGRATTPQSTPRVYKPVRTQPGNSSSSSRPSTTAPAAQQARPQRTEPPPAAASPSPSRPSRAAGSSAGRGNAARDSE